MTEVRYVDLDGAEPDEAVVVIDVLRAFTVQPWMFAQGVTRLFAVAERAQALALRDGPLTCALLAGEQGGRPFPGFDLGNSPTEVSERDLTGATVVHRTSAGTQGLVRTAGSGKVFAASFVTAGATARALQALRPGRVTFVITGASLGRNGDEDLAAAELIAARLRGDDPDPADYLARIADSDAGALFHDDGPDWAPPSDMALAAELDRFTHAVRAEPADGLDGVIATRAVVVDS
jgi:2-phosphosulfolactate phosphatase